MALKDRDRAIPRRLARLGSIRLGYKQTKTRPDGSEYTYPVQADHFVFTDAPKLVEHYGDDCREIDIRLPFPDIPRNFDAHYTVWAGGVLICKGDGDIVQYASPFSVTDKGNKVSVRRSDGDTLVSGGAACSLVAWDGREFQPGEIVPCSGARQDMYTHCVACRKSAILKVMMGLPELFRLGYYQIATGSGRNYDSILGIMEFVESVGVELNSMPWKLRLVEEPTVYVEAGKRHQTKKWFLRLDPPAEFQRLFGEYLMKRDEQLLTGEPITPLAALGPGEDIDEWEKEAPPPIAEQPEANGTKTDRPAPPETVRGWLRKKAGWSGDRRKPDGEQEPPNKKEVQRAAALMSKALESVGNANAVKLARYSCALFIFGISSLREMCASEVNAICSWLEARPGAFDPNGIAIEELRRIYSAALEENG